MHDGNNKCQLNWPFHYSNKHLSVGGSVDIVMDCETMEVILWVTSWYCNVKFISVVHVLYQLTPCFTLRRSMHRPLKPIQSNSRLKENINLLKKVKSQAMCLLLLLRLTSRMEGNIGILYCCIILTSTTNLLVYSKTVLNPVMRRKAVWSWMLYHCIFVERLLTRTVRWRAGDPRGR